MAQLTRTSGSGRLRRNAISVLGAVAIAMAFMGPATSVFFNTPPAVSGAGFALPLGILLALVACLLVASAIASFAQKIPTAGFAYTFNTRAFGKRGGFLSGWILVLSYGMVGPMLFAAIGGFSAQFLQQQFHLDIPWWILTIAFVALIWAIAASGIQRSARTALIFLALEVSVMLILFLTILGKGGAEGLSLGPFNPANSLNGISGLGIAMLWGILMFVGFESAGTLGEEASDAGRSIPIALFVAVAVIGTFYVLSGFAGAIGFGQSHVNDFVKDTGPWFTLGTRYWGGFAWIVALTVINSQFANLISGCNAAVRVIFSMAREGIFPQSLARTNATGGPQWALGAYMVFALLVAIIGGVWIGPFNVYAFCGTILGLGIVITYILINVALIVFYRREHRAEFSTVRHAVLPVAASLLMLLPIYGQVWPVPAFPINLVPYIVVAWILIGVGYLVYLTQQRPATLEAMGRVWVDEPSPASVPERV
jgi:amino acid transporter